MARRVVAPYETVTSLSAVRARRAGRARTARPYGVAPAPLHAAMAGGWQPFCGTMPLRAQRVLKGKGLIRKKGKTAGVPLLREPQRACMRATAAQRRLLASRSAQCGRVGRAPARWERAHPPPCRTNTQGWRAEVVAPYEKSTAAQAAPLPVGSGHPPHLAGAIPYNDLSVSA